MAKRLFDIVFSLAGLTALLPFMLLIAILVKAGSRGPILYKGIRIGLRGKPFGMCKFRTMRADADKSGVSSTADDDPRITRIGAVIRKYKLDELPQLVNVLKGEMSFVGPRPQVMWAVDLYSEDEKKVIFSVRPGITDYASLRFADEGEILKGSADPDKDYMEKIHPEKMRLSMEYVKGRSLKTDIEIILKTVLRVFGGRS